MRIKKFAIYIQIIKNSVVKIYTCKKRRPILKADEKYVIITDVVWKTRGRTVKKKGGKHEKR